MNNQLQIFNFNSKKVRTVIINDKPFFCLRDICNILGIENTTDVLQRLNKDGVDSIEVIDTMGRKQKANFINESNLYRTILVSRKEDAIKFQDWIVEEVLPSIRKTGQFNLMNPQQLIAAALIEASKLLEEQKPKVAIYETFISNKSSQKIGDVAKIFGIKPNTFHQMLRDAKIMQENYVPYAQYQHLFKIVETPTPAGFNKFTSYLLPEGVAFIARKFNLIELPENQIAQIN